MSQPAGEKHIASGGMKGKGFIVKAILGHTKILGRLAHRANQRLWPTDVNIAIGKGRNQAL
jgi:hypothetical protein